jgi:hypothetical protein
MTGIALSANEQQFLWTIDKNGISKAKLEQFLSRSYYNLVKVFKNNRPP